MSIESIRPVLNLSRLQKSYTPAAFFQSCRSRTLYSTCPPQTRLLHTQCLPSRSVHRRPQQIVPEKIAGRGFPRTDARRLTSTAKLNATVVRLNPRVDDEGNNMTIEITDRAAKVKADHIRTSGTELLVKPSTTSKDSHLRITVTSGGCHGFQYLMSLEGESKIDNEEDTIFVAEDSADGRAEVVMDSASLELLKGSTVDFTTELIGSQFKIVGNPRAKSSCGCGTSFDVD